MAYNLAKRIKILKGLTPYEFIRKIRISEPDRFNINSFQHTVGLNSLGLRNEMGLFDMDMTISRPITVPSDYVAKSAEFYFTLSKSF